MNRDMIEERGEPFHKKKLLMLLFMLFVIVIGIGAYFIDNDQKGNDIGVGKWVYNITYELDGGILPENAPKTYDNRKETALVNPTKEGYTFEGWTGSNGATPQKDVTITKGTSGDKTYAAKWKANTSVVSFNGNGGVLNGTSSIDTHYGDKINYEKVNTGGYRKFDKKSFESLGYAGYDFKNNVSMTVKFSSDDLELSEILIGNFENAGCGIYLNKNKIITEVYIEGIGYKQIPSMTNIEANKIYTATMTYDGNTLKLYINGKLENSLELPGKLRISNFDICLGTNYGQYIGGFFNGNIYYAGAFDKVLTEQEVLDMYNSDSLLDGYLTGVDYNGMIPYRDGYVFDGWYKNKECSGNKISNDYLIQGDETLYAKWSIAENGTFITVNNYQQNLNDSTYTRVDGMCVPVTTNNIVTLSDLRKGYIGFKYKEGKVDGIVTDKVSVKGDGSLVIDLYYDRIYYFFDLNGYLDGKWDGDLILSELNSDDKIYAFADVYINNQKIASQVTDFNGNFVYGSTFEIKNINVSSGRQFNGLYQNPNSNSASSLTGIIDALIQVNLDISSIKYNINYNLDGGTLPNNAPKTYTVDGLSSLPIPTKDGYKFLGWKEAGNSNYVTSIPKGSTGDKTFTVEYRPIILIEFTLQHEGEYPSRFITAEQGMTWEEFVNSKYNTSDVNLAIDEQGRVYQVGRGCILNVNKNDEIQHFTNVNFICSH